MSARAAAFAAGVLASGCGLVIGESFDGYTRFDAPFVVANGVAYPTSPGPAWEDAFGDFSTNVDNPRCYRGEARFCVVPVLSFRIVKAAPIKSLRVTGSRPLVIVSWGDAVIEEGGVLDIAGYDTIGVLGAGDHTAGTPSSRGAGGGNAEVGGAGCVAAGGASFDPLIAGLLAGGNGGGSGADPSCAGGSGAGAVQIVSLFGKVQISGAINAAGGDGPPGNPHDRPGCPDASGGGAGGTIWLQAPFVEFVSASGGQVQLAGGSGGGGFCSAGGTPTPATDPKGAVCTPGVYAGGNGGAGGGRAGKPEAAKPGIGNDASGTSSCGGGGGARGRLILQTNQTKCNSPSVDNKDGLCQERPL